MGFRGVGEGSGLACDLDQYDQTYWHLFLWDEAARAVVGAYRLGAVDELVASGGAQALYTTSLYRFRAPFLEHVRHGVELGRSFVQPAYQKGFLPLLLLWKGIAAFVARDPRRRHLFGTVSISAGTITGDHVEARFVNGVHVEARTIIGVHVDAVEPGGVNPVVL